MAESIRFYLNHDTKGRDEKVIYCYVRYAGKTMTLNTGERVNPVYWNKKDDCIDIEKAKQDKVKGITALRLLNEHLTNYKVNIKSIVRELKTSGEPFTFELLKKSINAKLNPEKEMNFFETFELFIDSRRNKLSKATSQKYNAIKNHISDYSQKNNAKVTLNSINKGFFEDLERYYIEIGISHNTIRKNFQFIKAFLRWSVDRELTTNIKFEKFKNIKSVETDAISLTENDIQKILNCKNLPDSLERVRDVFFFLLFTGQRYSDGSKFNYSDISNGYWNIRQRKTKKLVKPYLAKQALQILNKYNNTLPIISNQKMNEHLKKLGQLAGLTEIVTITKIVGNDTQTKQMAKYDLLGTHTARRTFVTLGLYKGISEIVLGSQTGHASNDNKMLAEYFRDNPNGMQEVIQGFVDHITGNHIFYELSNN